MLRPSDIAEAAEVPAARLAHCLIPEIVFQRPGRSCERRSVRPPGPDHRRGPRHRGRHRQRLHERGARSCWRGSSPRRWREPPRNAATRSRGVRRARPRAGRRRRRGRRGAPGGLDVVVANAGVAAQLPLLGGDPEVFERTIEVNLIGVYYTLRAAGPQHRPRAGLCARDRLARGGGHPPLLAPTRVEGRRRGPRRRAADRACSERGAGRRRVLRRARHRHGPPRLRHRGRQRIAEIRRPTPRVTPLERGRRDRARNRRAEDAPWRRHAERPARDRASPVRSRALAARVERARAPADARRAAALAGGGAAIASAATSTSSTTGSSTTTSTAPARTTPTAPGQGNHAPPGRSGGSGSHNCPNM